MPHDEYAIFSLYDYAVSSLYNYNCRSIVVDYDRTGEEKGKL